MKLSVDITERKRLAAELIIANKELESFTYSISHDLRAPLRIINGYAGLITTENKSLNEDTKRMLGNIVINSKRMGDLVDGLLNFSRLGRRELMTHKTDMNSIVNEIVEGQFKNSNISKYKINIHDLPKCFCDSRLVKQIWENLISNAIKFSANNKNPIIEIGSTKKENNPVYFIQDNGAGFDMKYYDKLLGVFQRLHSVSEFEGNGTGLAFTQRIIHKHGGQIWAESKVNKGSTFYFKVSKS